MKKVSGIHHHSQVLVNPLPEADLLLNVSVDCVILGFDEEALKVLLVQHNGGPRDGEWALPGDFVDKKSNLAEMPYQVLNRLAGIKDIYVNQLGAFGDLNRVDYRRIVTIAYYALINTHNYTLKIGPGAKNVEWFDIDKVPDLIFDHSNILNTAITKIRRDLDFEPIGYELLPRNFTLTQMQKLYEAILGEQLDTRNFRRKILKGNILIDTGKVASDVPYRAPKLYSFKKKDGHKQ